MRSPKETNLESCPTRNPRPARRGGAPLPAERGEGEGKSPPPPPPLELELLPERERELVREKALVRPPLAPTPGAPPPPPLLAGDGVAVAAPLAVLFEALLRNSVARGPMEMVGGRVASSGMEVVEEDGGKKCQPAESMEADARRGAARGDGDGNRA